MKNYGIQRSCVVPDEVEITSEKVFITKDIHEVKVKHEDDEHIEYEFNLVEYDKDEYIKMQSEENALMKTQMETTQEAVDFLLLGGL